MARIALIDADGVVVNVVIAEVAWIASLPEWYRARCPRALEVVTEDEIPETADAIVTRDCEPGARFVDRAATPEEIAAHDVLGAAQRGRRDVPLDALAADAGVSRDLAMRAASGPRDRVLGFVRS